MKHFLITLLIAVTVATTWITPIHAQQSSNYGITVVPAPGPVTIDGDLKDWDWSGRLWIYPDKAIASQYSLEVAAMWDAKNLYLAAHFKDPTPMMNMTDPRTQPGWGWRSDAMQIRFKTDRLVALTTWYYTAEKLPVVAFNYGKDLKSPFGGESFCLFKPDAADPTDLGRGVKEAFKVDADGKGYVQEMSIPWNLLYAQPPTPAAGQVFKLGFEEFWGDASGKSSMPFMRFADNIQPNKNVDRIRFFGQIDGWGDATLSATGHVETRQYADENEKMAGTVPVHYQLPTDGPLPKTYRVTLAVVDPKNPNWIVSTFAAGVVRTVTAENQGKFTETWNGLDDNYMPIPAGTYGVKGIYMPAETWPIDGEVHTLIPHLTSIGSSWGQSPAEDAKPSKIDGDPVGSPFAAVDVAPNGKGVVYFQYLENGTNGFLTDFTQPNNYDQIITGYGSGSVGGGSSACTDGQQIWIIGNAWHQFILHADGSPFGTQNSPGRQGVYLPEGWVKGMSAWRDPVSGHSVVFVAEAGRIVQGDKPWRFGESETDRVDRIVALDGTNADLLAQWKIDHPLGLAARNGHLYVLHGTGGGAEVDSFALDKDWKQEQLKTLFAVPSDIKPFDITADSHGRVYLSDPDANHVYQFDAQGKKLLTYGKLDTQKEGHYDTETFMSPQKLSCWTDADGQDRLMVVEMAGPNRLSEWNGDGKLLRQWVVPQTHSNNGYAIDPKHPDQVYMEGQGNSLVRWTIDYTTGQWIPNAVWQNFALKFNGVEFEMPRPRVSYHGNDLYLTFSGGHTSTNIVYKLEGDHLRACSAILSERMNNKKFGYIWRDLNGDGQIQDEEYKPFATELPQGVPKVFGGAWLSDLSFVCIGVGTPDVWRLSPTGFDDHGNPIFDPNGWKKLLTDDVFTARKAGTADPLHGGNELASAYTNAWSDVAPAADGGFYVCARSGPDFSANQGTQYKLSRYVPDGNGGFTQKWRVGRIALEGTARPGEAYSPIFVSSPVNGLVGIVDNSRAGMLVFSEDGLYVDTLLPDGRIVSPDQRGAYYTPGEFFAGYAYLNHDNGKVYLAMGKLMPEIYEIGHWTTTDNPVHPLTTVDSTVSIDASQIVAPPESALSVRAAQPGAAVVAHTAQFTPAPEKGPALDGSLAGWNAATPVTFGASDTQNVEVRCLYDKAFLYLRWHARVGHAFEPKELQPADRIFTHDRLADTLGFYLQCDPKAVPGKGQNAGRPGDVRFVFGVFSDGGKTVPAVLGLYPKWMGTGMASPLSYNSPVGHTAFEHVGLLADAKLGYKSDADGKGFVLTAAIPVSDLPGTPGLSGWKTTGNFDANLGGTNKFWWANTDGSANRDTFDEPSEARLYPGSWSTIEFKSP